MWILSLHTNIYPFLTESQIQRTKIPQNPTRTKPLLLLRFSPRSILTTPRRRLLSSSGHRPPSPSDEDEDNLHPSSHRRRSLLSDADQIFSILQQDGLGFEARTAINDLWPDLIAALVHVVLRRIHSSMTTTNKSRSAKLAFKFFAWASDQPQATLVLTTSKGRYVVGQYPRLLRVH
ncbi:hypothetical protein IHE45_18G048600 [Dioscorea alata]|uniref:Uncharacterized protein n=1 Tax=Dioscorea alata TaxID=55571 RepID=A0ACB7U6Q1_DIOAL|nr:hypothetical protein IHE45_18G048600 [Dioscorea alata]